jgi:hypothetical protein
MIRSEIESKYGKDLTEKIFASRYMKVVTCLGRIVKEISGESMELDFYEDDIDRAYRDVTGKFVHPMEWD